MNAVNPFHAFFRGALTPQLVDQILESVLAPVRHQQVRHQHRVVERRNQFQPVSTKRQQGCLHVVRHLVSIGIGKDGGDSIAERQVIDGAFPAPDGYSLLAERESKVVAQVRYFFGANNFDRG